MAASDGPKVGDVALVLNAIDGITAKDDADPVSVAVADIGFVWCAGTLAEVSGSDFVHAAPDGAHEPILGRCVAPCCAAPAYFVETIAKRACIPPPLALRSSFVVVPSFPSRCPMAPAALRPGVRVLVQWDTEGDDKVRGPCTGHAVPYKYPVRHPCSSPRTGLLCGLHRAGRLQPRCSAGGGWCGG